MPRRRPRSRSQLVKRWLAAGVLLLIASAYVQPLKAYLGARAEAERAREEVALLENERKALAARVAVARTEAFVEREARKLGFVRPGERLFIVNEKDR